MTQKKTTSDALEILYQRYYANNKERQAALEKARVDDEVARKLIALRSESQLSQQELALLIGTNESVIQQLENADYKGNSLALLTRIATVLNMRVKIDFVKIEDNSGKESVSPPL